MAPDCTELYSGVVERTQLRDGTSGTDGSLFLAPFNLSECDVGYSAASDGGSGTKFLAWKHLETSSCRSAYDAAVSGNGQEKNWRRFITICSSVGTDMNVTM